MAAAIARVLVDKSGGHAFDYAVPPELNLEIGTRVQVPLGKRTAVGTIVALPETAQVPGLKMILGVAGETAVLPQSLIDLAWWIADYYCSGIEAAMRAILPNVIRKAQVKFKELQHVRLAGSITQADLAALAQRAPGQAKALRSLQQAAAEMPVVELLTIDGVSRQGLAVLEKKGLVVIEKRRGDRDPHGSAVFLHDGKLQLTAEQQDAMDAILPALENPKQFKPFLLHGVTGSGKTEIYLQALERVLALGRSAIVLVPEISLTPQTVERFKSRFADIQGEVAVLHSYLSDGERHDEWHKIHAGKARIVIGPRSAVFAPLKKLGLIIVDEEHENSYKQEEAPRYNARDIAVVRGSRENCAIILGSATPCHESYHNAQIGKYQLLELNQRIDGRKMPHIRIIDMRLQSRGKKKEILSERLCQAIEERLDKGEQSILFLNRRGFSTSLTCEVCGHVCQCHNCSLPLTYHRARDRLICHLCGYSVVAPRKCPECSDPKIKHAGSGTEKVEDAVKRLFPGARVARMDADTMTRKHSYSETLGAFRARKIDILVGTQMIAKGLHFPNVTLVGIVLADIGLQMADFRASERTFQLLTQVAGRAGRGEVAGEVFVQSFTPFHPAIQFARHHAYRDFYDQDDEFRRAFGFPPHTHMVLVTVRSRNEARVKAVSGRLAKLVHQAKIPNLTSGEPTPAPIEKLKGFYRYHLTLRAKSVRRMTRQLQEILTEFQCPKDVVIAVDVDPLNLL